MRHNNQTTFIDMKNWKLVLTAIFYLCVFSNIYGQGWARLYQSGFGNSFLSAHKHSEGYCINGEFNYLNLNEAGDSVLSVVQNPITFIEPLYLDDGFVITSKFVDINSSSKNQFTKFNFNNELVWEYHTLRNNNATITSTSEGGILILEPYDSSNYKGLYATKLNVDGSLDWSKPLFLPEQLLIYYVYELVGLADGSYMCGGHTASAANGAGHYFLRFDTNGNLIWKRNDYDDVFMPTDVFTKSLVTQAGALILAGRGLDSTFIAKLDIDGNLIWLRNEQTIGVPFSFSSNLIELPSGNILFASSGLIGNGSNFPSLTKMNPAGELIWENNVVYFGEGISQGLVKHISYLPSGQLILGGNAIRYGIPNQPNYFLVLADTLGNIHPHFIEGKLFNDQVADCQYDSNEVLLPNLVVRAKSGTNTYYTASNHQGDFRLNIPAGDYEVSIGSSPYWETCQPTYNLSVNPQNDTAYIPMPVQPIFECAMMNVDISTPFIRNCSTGVYVVKYCNQGYITAINATLQVFLAPELTYVGTTGNLLSQDGQLLTFALGSIGSLQYGNFSINFMLECSDAMLGQTLCTEAHAFPDAPCLDDPFNGPVIEASANCQGDSVAFNIKNIGSDMGQPFQYIVVEDNIILRIDQFQLAENEEVTFNEEAQEGASYHLIAAQDPNLPPILGNPIATAAVEGCVGSVNPGGLNQFQLNDGQPWLDVDCHPVIAAFDPNDKTGFPTGWQEEHFIDERTELDYLIRFQNTGTDTAFRVVLIDTLSAFLEPATIRPGASSHPYRMELSGQGVLAFIFDGIMLPDSNVNEALSHGFVQFHIAQQPDNQPGTRIENTAGIYFDFNAPVYTNTTFHTVREPWVQVLNGSVETEFERMEVKISPNPMGDWAVMEIENLPPGENTLVVFDNLGREVARQAFIANKALVQREGLAAGLYFFKVQNGSKHLSSGKLIVR
jgi:hypothetical protein